MGGKKQPGRFTIQFNLSDPQQRQVIELLNEQGRRKAVFLTAAVLSYCGKNNVTQILPQPQMDLEAIEKVVRSVLESVSLQSTKPENGMQDKAEPKCVQTSDLSEKPAETTDLPDDVMDSICEMIDAFRI